MRPISPKCEVLAKKYAKIEYLSHFNLTLERSGRIIIMSYTTDNISDLGYIIFYTSFSLQYRLDG